MSRTNINYRCTVPAGSSNSTGANLIKQEKSMKIEDVTLVNGNRADQLSDEALICEIVDELGKRERLTKTLDRGVESKALDNLVLKHTYNIKKLTDILDSRAD